VKIYKASFNRENLFYYVRPKEDAYEQIVNYIRGRPKDSGIIYCQSRQTTENLAEKLREDGFRALPYHAGMASELRSENQERFIHDDVEIIVATIAFGMGINKTNVRYVIHYDLPKNLESYYQETGRAGRDRLESDCILFFSYGDKVKIEVLIEKKKNPERKRIAYKKLNAMINFCESAGCRRKTLLEYFGETYKERCGKCDTCLQPRETFDGTEAAKKVLGCVQDIGGRFGINYVVSILEGKENKRSKAYNHHSLKSYGIGKEYTAKQWQTLIRELIRNGFLDVVGDKYPVLKLNQKSRDILTGRLSVFLAKPAESPIVQIPIPGASSIDADLFDILRALRKNIADIKEVPPYVIFHDTTLKEMATYYPQDIENMKKIHGIGQIKLEKYGKIFLEKIADYCKLHNINLVTERVEPIKEKDMAYEKWAEADDLRLKNENSRTHSDTHMKTLDLCRQGLTLEQVAKTRNLAASTIVSHIEKLLVGGEDIDIDAFVSVEKQKIIQECLSDMGSALTPIKETLGNDYSYDEIRLVRAKSIFSSSKN
jgi:ATP-dependent DNA helicase RecQ